LVKPEISIEELDAGDLTRWLQNNVWDREMTGSEKTKF
jgi:hypothetical protein